MYVCIYIMLCHILHSCINIIFIIVWADSVWRAMEQWPHFRKRNVQVHFRVFLRGVLEARSVSRLRLVSEQSRGGVGGGVEGWRAGWAEEQAPDLLGWCMRGRCEPLVRHCGEGEAILGSTLYVCGAVLFRVFWQLVLGKDLLLVDVCDWNIEMCWLVLVAQVYSTLVKVSTNN